MSGLAVLFHPHSTEPERRAVFVEFVPRVGKFKNLTVPLEFPVGRDCTAAKLDSDATAHPGITRDAATGSWLLVAGTLVDMREARPAAAVSTALLQAYLARGAAALDAYDGHYALALYDGRQETLALLSDPMGMFSIFYGRCGAQWFIATSALAVAQQIRAAADPLAVESFLRTGRAYGETTLWQEVKRAPPATLLTLTPAGPTHTPYWQLRYDADIARLPLPEAVDQATTLLRHTFQCGLQREGEVWADLTGGFDTRLGATLMAQLELPFAAYCAGDDDQLDVQLSRRLSEVMGWDYRAMPLPADWETAQCAGLEPALWYSDVRLSAPPLTGVLWGHQQRAQRCKVHVTGGGGEAWHGTTYLTGNLLTLGQRGGVNYEFLLDGKFFTPAPPGVLRAPRYAEVRQEFKAYLQGLTHGYTDLPNACQLDVIFMKHRHPTHAGAYLSAVSGVIRSVMPFCFKAATEFAFSLPYAWKFPYHYRFERALLERLNPRGAALPTTTGGPALPIRLHNLPHFWPLWKKLGLKGYHYLARRWFRQSPNRPTAAVGAVPVQERRRQGWVRHSLAAGWLVPDTMYSAAFYAPPQLAALVAQAESAPEFPYAEFLGRVLSVELALRAAAGIAPQESAL